MMQINHVRVLVTNRCVHVSVGVRLRAFPPLVLMLMMVVVRVHVLMSNALVSMLHITIVGRRPEHSGGRSANHGKRSKHGERGTKAKGRADETGERIGKQPAKV